MDKGYIMLTRYINYQLHPFVSFCVLSHSVRVHKCEQHISLRCAPRELYFFLTAKAFIEYSVMKDIFNLPNILNEPKLH